MFRFVTYTFGQGDPRWQEWHVSCGLAAVMDLLPLAQVCDELWHKAGENLPLSPSEPQSWCERWGSAERGTGNRWERRFLRMLQISEFPAQSHTWERQGSPEPVSLHRAARTEPQQGDCEFPGYKVNTRSIFLHL